MCPYALLDSPLPSLPRALLRLVQRSPIPGPCHRVESPLYRQASLRRSAHATGETLSLTVTLPNAQRIEVPEVVVRWSSEQECAVENLVIEAQTDARLHHVVTRVMQEPAEIVL